LSDLEELGDMMSQMLERQHIEEVCIKLKAAFTPSPHVALISATNRVPVIRKI
jgi:hypothetical protein